MRLAARAAARGRSGICVAYQLADGAVGGDFVDVYHFDNGNVATHRRLRQGRAGCGSRALVKHGLRCYASEGSPRTCTAFTDRVFVENNAFERTASFASVFLASIDSIAARSPIARRDTSRSSCAATRRAARRAPPTPQMAWPATTCGTLAGPIRVGRHVERRPTFVDRSASRGQNRRFGDSRRHPPKAPPCPTKPARIRSCFSPSSG